MGWQFQDSAPLHQWTVTRVSKSMDVWGPMLEEDVGKLDRIVVEKNVPQLFILLSRDPFSEQYRCARLALRYLSTTNCLEVY